ncbi:MAG: antiterminator LoaP [Lachnospiraceae bacterium]|nr:antiterminator LoaP [Lachnospiraceae bacterium]MCI8813644.1 antiterminator LoaP [Lachnospiraceae bacterium]
MYYVIQVSPGTEEQTECLIRGRVDGDLYGLCFHPIRHVRKKFHGAWKDVHEKLLPGYVFLTSDRIRELYLALQRVPRLTKVLGKDEELFVALKDGEVEWLVKLTGVYETEGKNDSMVTVPEIGLSQVLMEQDMVTILSGPLKSVEGKIKKINLHKRMAEVEVEFMGRKTVIYLGVEMVGRKNADEIVFEKPFHK